MNLVAGALVTAGLVASPAMAQDVPAINQGNVSLEIGADVASEYIFRGVTKQNKGFIFQPYATVGVAMPEFAGIESEVYFGTWNSFHDRGQKWFQADFFIGAAAEVYEGLVIDAAYVTRRDPAADASLTSEVNIGVSYDESELTEPYGMPALNPFALVAIETQGGLYGANRGVFLELGVEPSFELTPEESDYPITLSVPTTVGVNVHRYHQVEGNADHAFSYFNVGARVGMPLRFIPREYGQWSASAGVHAQWSGRNVRALNQMGGFGGDVFNTYGTIGVSMTY
ncbi:hypothetical protein ACERK3_10350 [Phycisphaerales bacterium AB-hyl4]|uniref:Uncharacterized protein n=1 Tax=Natronomicrosphaera hydrolytica TaxID=3242702 RepID=A0ABV4U517_9BACT